MADPKASWNKENLGYSPKMPRHFPAEYLLRALFSRSYFKLWKESTRGQKVLDLGCLYLNNLAPFQDRGAELFGVEINQDMVEIAREQAAARGMDVELSQGDNRHLPYADNTFDFVLSINTIHYEQEPELLMAGLREISRVGKADCHYLISTAGNQHHLHQKATRLGPSRYRLKTGEFRDGQVMRYFDDEDHFGDRLGEVFDPVEVAVVTERYPLCSLEFYVAKCGKR